MPGLLRVNSATVAEAGQGFSAAANRFAVELSPFVATGNDALSSAAASQQQVVEAPLVDGVAATGAAAVSGGQSVSRAAQLYVAADNQGATGLSATLNPGAAGGH